ncbi:aminotransferase class III-fold pyridoxal phosphate-dependent enzyme (plasmid) [Azospirillum argentinense]|uniref:Aminotransferase class III-fold pyridoxal phosphate-dependent enzyme n=1 Tax=Azospirillum argentinense TaxID=2970906 RepID=A0A4D8Q1Q1_9PROT|nr:aminotransferase class III-fold pyridoxal phosphate-dependent enzyme [Azospirillum argentinense]QCO00282.1 aminotransferase class III-fold pyridoxal phosphate-dependent enzyme [Azospirillum argentinense]
MALPSVEMATSERNAVLDGVLGIFSRILKVPPSRIVPDASLAENGIDSLALFDVFEPIKATFGVGLSMQQVLVELRTVREIASFVAGRMGTPSTGRADPAQADGRTADVRAGASLDACPDGGELLPPESADPAGGPTGNVHNLIQSQLDIMALQLRLLGRAPADMVAEPADAPSSRVASTEKLIGMPFITVSMSPATCDDPQAAEYVRAFTARYTAQTRRSKEHATEFRALVADCRNSIGFDHHTKELHYPIVADRMADARVWDIDGNEYVDMTMGFGVHLLGHDPSGLRDALTTGASFGLGLRNSHAIEVARLLTGMTGMDRVLFVNDGTEAVMSAVKVARASTGRNRIVLFDLSYHGHWDGVLARGGKGGDRLRARPLFLGVTPGAVEDTVVFEFGSEEALRYVRDHSSDIAAVLIEPVPLRDPTRSSPDFLRALRAATRDAGVALIFDEMITGFRCHPAGIQGLYGIEADIATYGKVLGGGMPIGVVAGRSAILDSIDGGPWSYGDDSYPRARTTMVGGTYFQHPLSMIAARFTLEELARRGAEFPATINGKAARLMDGFNEIFHYSGVPVEAKGFGSFFRLYSDHSLSLLYHNLLLRGVYIWEWRSWFLSAAHTEADIDAVLAAMQESIEELQRHGVM